MQASIPNLGFGHPLAFGRGDLATGAMRETSVMSAIEPDYDRDPGRFLAWRPQEDVQRVMDDPRPAVDVRPPITVTKRGCLVWAHRS